MKNWLRLSIMPCLCLLLLAGVSLGLTSCASGDFRYSEEERQALFENPSINLIVEARFKRKGRLKNLRGIDIEERREGFGRKAEYFVTFTIIKSLKGKAEKDIMSVAVALPSMAFGMTPGEYPGQRRYVLYMKDSERRDKLQLVGAEWETIY